MLIHYERPKITTYKPGDVRKYAHLKRDGIFVQVIGHGDENHVPTCLTRHPDGAHEVDLSGGSRIGEQLYSLRRHRFLGALFCELYSPGEEASQVKSHLAAGNIGLMRLECFAIPSQSANLSLESLRDYCKLLRFPFVDFDQMPVACNSQDMYHWISTWKGDDTEGYVFKDGNLLNWCKWKPVLTTDLVVIGFKEGKGKYLGTLGALELGLSDGSHVCNCSGMDDETRDLISENEEDWLGAVVEVAYQRRDSGGGLRHPRFIRRREDKGASECNEI